MLLVYAGLILPSVIPLSILSCRKALWDQVLSLQAQSANPLRPPDFPSSPAHDATSQTSQLHSTATSTSTAGPTCAQVVLRVPSYTANTGCRGVYSSTRIHPRSKGTRKGVRWEKEGSLVDSGKPPSELVEVDLDMWSQGSQQAVGLKKCSAAGACSSES